MGCDIHAVIEVRDNTNKTWVGVTGQLGLGRNYEAFAALAGVRSSGNDDKKSKVIDDGVALGLPPDISQTAKYFVDGWGGDGHSHSHLPIREFCKRWLLCEDADKVADLIRQEIERVAGYSSDTAWVKEYERLFGYYMDDADDYRVVFWFDN